MHRSFTQFAPKSICVLLVLLLSGSFIACSQTLPEDSARVEKPLYVRATVPESFGSQTMRGLKREKRRMQQLDKLFKRRAAATNAPLSGVESNARTKNAYLLQTLSGQIDSLASVRSKLSGKEMMAMRGTNVPKLDSATLLNLGKGLLQQTRYGQVLEEIGSGPRGLIPAEVEQVSKQIDEGVKALPDKEQIGHYVRAKAAKLATAEFADKLPQLQEAQRQFSRYQRKMAWLKEGSGENANSLKDASFGERFTYGGNFQVIALEPLSVIAAPFAGFRLNRKMVAGVRFSITSPIGKNTLRTKPFGGELGYSGFMDYKLPTSWFARGEFERMSKAVPNPNKDGYDVTWRNNAYVGVGRYIGTIRNFKITAVLQCNLLHKQLRRLDATAFQFRFGITK